MRYGLAFVTAVFSASYFSHLLIWPWLLMLGAIGFFCVYKRYFTIALIFLGVIYSHVWGYSLLHKQLPKEYNNQLFLIDGVVVGLPAVEEHKIRFDFHLYAIQSENNNFNQQELARLLGEKVRLSWYQSNTNDYSQVDLKPGQRWQFLVKLRRPRGLVNPAGFDYQLYLLQQGLVATGYVRDSSVKQLVDENCLLAWLSCWRYHVKRQLLVADVGTTRRGILMGLLVGDRQLIADDQWQLLKHTGTIHLLAISGLHIGLAAMVGGLLGGFIRRTIQLIKPQIQLHCFVPILALLVACGYGMLAGMTLPTQRALIMVAVYCIHLLFYKQPRPFTALTTALVIVALWDPLAVQTVSFWLSYVAVAVLLLTYCAYLPQFYPGSVIIRPLLKVIKAQWAISVGLLVPSILLLQGMSIAAPIANLIAVPWVSLVTVPLVIATIPLMDLWPAAAARLWQWADVSVEWLLWLLHWLNSELPRFQRLSLAEQPWWVIGCGVLGLLWLLLPRSIGARWLGLLCLLPLFVFDVKRPLLQITFLDVGQGTSVIVETTNHVVVYDVGRHFSDRFDAGADIVAPYLLQKQRQQIDRLIISHGDSDHAGGSEGLQEVMAITELYSGQPEKTGGRPCVAGQTWQWDQVHFEVLWPPLNMDSDNANNFSCVVSVSYDNHRVLLTGDIETSVEQRLLNDSMIKPVDIVLVPHHGSKTSSSELWVSQLKPSYSVVTAGFANHYGHPHPDVVTRYRDQNAVVINTADTGAIQFTLDEKMGWQVELWRQLHHRYWFDQ